MSAKNRKVKSAASVAGVKHGVIRAVAKKNPIGFSPVVRAMELEFDLLRLKKGSSKRERTTQETVLVLLSGSVDVTMGDAKFTASRTSLFDDGPATFHCGAGTALLIRATTADAELAVIRAENSRALAVRFYGPAEVMTEDRGAGLAQGACRRLVRTIFDYTTRPDSNLVVGEVVNFPGRWSSYPGHHHPQPEIYHYRFTLPQGYGHAELGDDVFKIRDRDTVLIPGGLDHAQVSAPGYGMYYLWIVRHLPRRPYKGFNYSREHTWLLDPAQQGWQPALKNPTP